jgi:uncharacterized membrane protein
VKIGTGTGTCLAARLRQARQSLANVRLPAPLLIPAGGVLLGFYLSEFLRYNLDFTGPLPLGPLSVVLLTVLAGPGLLALVWLLAGLAVAGLTGLPLRRSLELDARSYLPTLLFGLSLLGSLLAGRPLSAYHAAVVVLATTVISLVLAAKVWLVQPLVKPAWRTRLASRWWLLVAIAVFVLVLGLLVGLRYQAYDFWGVDLAQFDQALWNTWQGRLLQFTQYGGVPDTLLTDHVEPIMLLIAPLYLVWPDPRLLLILQVVALAWGAWLAYWLARRFLRNRGAGLVAALAYLVHPAVVGNALDASGGFRPDVLTVPLFLGLVLAVEEQKWGRALLLAVLAMSCKEYMAALVLMLGLYLLYRYRRQRLALGLGLAGQGALWLIGALAVWLPLVRGGQGSLHYELNFGNLGGGGGISGILETLVTQPGLLASLLFSSENLLALFFGLLSLALLPLGDLALLLVGAPLLGLFALNGVSSLFDFHLAPILPFFFAAAVAGTARLSAWGDRRLRLPPRRLAMALSALLLGASLGAGFFWGNGPLSWGFWSPGRPYTFWQDHYLVDTHDRRADRFVAMVPAGAAVIASDFLLARLGQREHVYHFYDPPPAEVLDQVDYAVVDLFETYVRPPATGLRAIVETPSGESPGTGQPVRATGKELVRLLLASGDFRLTAAEDGLLFLRRAPAGADSLLQAIDRVNRADPAVVVNNDFAGRLRLLGYDLEGDPAALVAGRRYRIAYYWQVLAGYARPFTYQYGTNPVDDVQFLDDDYVLIDTFTCPGSEPFRVVHLPTYLLLPPSEWQAGDLLREEYDFVLPPDLAGGTCTWQVGLYLVPDYFPIQATPGRQVPGSAPLPMPDVHGEEAP